MTGCGGSRRQIGSTENIKQHLKSHVTGTLHLGLRTAVRAQFREHCPEEQAASAVAIGAVIVALRQAVIQLSISNVYVLTFSHI